MSFILMDFGKWVIESVPGWPAKCFNGKHGLLNNRYKKNSFISQRGIKIN